MNLRQQLIADRVDNLSARLGVEPDHAFLRLVHSLVTGMSVHSFDLNDVVDGGQDKQLDVITIEEEEEVADVFVLQTKYTESFSSNALIQLGNGLSWLLTSPRKDFDRLSNNALRDKIREVRSVVSGLGPSNIRLHVRFVTLGLTGNISAEFSQELVGIRKRYDNDTFESFSIEALGADQLIELSKIQERQTRRVDADIKIRYDANNPSLIKHYSADLKGLVCSVPASEIARLVNENPDGAVFDLNIRRFLGTRGGVNRDIHKTCSSSELSHEFWFLNNGITIVCDSFDPVTDPDNPHVKLKNLQIVNGCQTATTLALARAEGVLKSDVRVITRIYESKDPDLVSRIVLTTNNQNQISSRDLRSNDPVQIDMEQGFAMRGYFYERKPRQYEGESVDVAKLLPNEFVAQSYLAVVLRTPSDARARKYKVWGDLHAKIFSGGPVEPYIVAATACRRAGAWLRASTYPSGDDELSRIIARRGAFHVTRIAVFLWRRTDDWKIPEEELRDLLEQVESGNVPADSELDEAFQILQGVIASTATLVDDPDRALKSGQLDREVTDGLHRNHAKP